MTRLSVNINKIATLRNARGGNIPNLRQIALDCVRFGAQGITVHPRPDERHIRKQDVLELSEILYVEFNIEGYPSEDFLKLIEKVKPAQCTLVPDPPDVLTSNKGWDTIKNKSFLQEVVGRLSEAGVRTSLFMGTEQKFLEGAAVVKTKRIELFTGPYADQYSIDKDKAISPFREAARVSQKLGLELNAGHDLNLTNLKFLKQNLPNLIEVSIGHALISDALYFGLEETIRRYKAELE